MRSPGAGRKSSPSVSRASPTAHSPRHASIRPSGRFRYTIKLNIGVVTTGSAQMKPALEMEVYSSPTVAPM